MIFREHFRQLFGLIPLESHRQIYVPALTSVAVAVLRKFLD
jgi:hypothetical protein